MNPRQFYEARAKSIVKEVRESKDISYKELARRLEAQGVVTDAQVLINRVNQGKFSFAFALQLLAAMGVEHLEVPRQEPKLKKLEPKKPPR
ncbi:MAG: hypothetical protein HKL99_01340 [Burkholderiales bacterium]|nr:hypothetical protein [Burkholderiales bacterium]